MEQSVFSPASVGPSRALQVPLSLGNHQLVEQLRSRFDSSVEAIATAVETRDGYTEAHCRRLALFSTIMAEQLELEAREIEAIRIGALLHDVGKLGVREELLRKAGRFTAAERVEMQSHADIGYRISSSVPGLSPITPACVRHHHECWDGSGYPDGLRGEEIPLGARIVSIVDVWDALSTTRPYKPAYPQQEACELLLKWRGSHFDPALLDLFLRILEEEGEEMLAIIDCRVAASASPRTAA